MNRSALLGLLLTGGGGVQTREWTEHIAVAAFVVDHRGRICASNRAFRALVGTDDLVGTPVSALAPEAAAELAGARVPLGDASARLASPERERPPEARVGRGRLLRGDERPLDVGYRTFALTRTDGPPLDVVLVSTLTSSGSVELSSEHAAFAMSIGDCPPPAIEADPPCGPQATRRARLLVVDDEERLAETLRMALAYSHDVTIATSGRDALAKILGADEPFDLVLCDLFLPDISGPEIYAEVERTRPELLARFIFLTGGAFTESARRFLEDIDNPRLEKPFDLSALERLIDERLALFSR
ncbi:MAG: response regulator [Polyangiaceae bacterium]